MKGELMRAGYFVRGEELPQEMDPRFDVVVVPWRTLWLTDNTAIVRGYQEAGIAVHVHQPFCYTNPNHTTPVHQRIQAVLNGADGWLLGADGERVGQQEWKLIDPRSAEVRRGLLDIHLDVLNDADWTPDGLFVDFLWDRVAWMDAFSAWTSEQRAALDEEYRNGLYAMATGMKFRLGKAGYSTLLYGNGWHRCTVLDGTILENFPLTVHEEGHRGLDVALLGYYGKATWTMFRKAPIILPAGGDMVAYNIPRFRVVEAVGFAAAFCPDAIVFDNSGFLFEVIDKVEDE